MGQHCGQLSTIFMDRYIFVRCLAGTKSMGQRRCIKIYLQLESVELVEHIKEISEKNNKTWKHKLSLEAISSEGYC